MYKCEICGRESFKKIRYGGYTLCSKHMHQYQQHKKFLDSNPRTQNDLNEIEFDCEKGIAFVSLYDTKQEVKAKTIIDIEDVDTIKYHRWRLSYGYVVTGNNTNKTPTVYMSHLIAGAKKEHRVDHIDGNPLNNRKSNLRICTQSENTLNKHYMALNTSGVIGVSKDKRRKNCWCAEIRYQNKRYHIGQYKVLEEAAYARYIAQNRLFKDFSFNDNFKNIDFSIIPISRRKDIENFVNNKITLRA